MAIRGLCTLVGAFALTLMAAVSNAQATTIYTYGFSQELTTRQGDSAVIAGSFKGTTNALGYIDLTTLSEFHVDYSTIGMQAHSSGLPDFFSFQVGDASGSTLAFLSPVFTTVTLFDYRVCVGVAVAALCNGGTARGVFQVVGASSNFAAGEIAPLVTLVSSTSPSPIASTPIPGAMLLFTTALAGGSAICALGRRASAV